MEFFEYLTNPGSGHHGGMSLIHTTHQTMEV